jgi:hypothetical protein
MRFADLFSLDLDEQEPPEPPVEHERPEWLGPPNGELGVSVPIGLVLARSDRGAIAVSHAVAYSSGVSFDLVAHVGGLKVGQANSIFHEQHAGRLGVEELPDGFFRFGVELPDGTRVSNLAQRRPWAKPDQAPHGPVLFQSGGGGGQSSGTSVSWNLSFWLWPLPSEGLLRLYCEWPIANIGVSHVQIEMRLILEAASKAIQLWSDEGGGWSGGASTSHMYAVGQSLPASTEAARMNGDVEGEAIVAVPVAEFRAAQAALQNALLALRRFERT